MKRPTFNENTEVKVVDKNESCYGERGTVVKFEVLIDPYGRLDPIADKEQIKQAYALGLEHKIEWFVLVRFFDKEEVWFNASSIEAVQHKFIDIDYLREEAIVLGTKPDGTQHVRPTNTGAFEVGDIISITTKIDGANASIAWDETTGKLEVFSRTNLLDSPGALRGFYDYIKTNVEPNLDLSKNPDLVIFGEWCVGHSIKTYDKSWYNKWRVYDIWNKKLDRYMTQDVVASFCSEYGLEYIEQLYEGPFISWDHCRSFLHASKAYGPDQEGIVVKNQDKLMSKDRNAPAYIKIVNDKFIEHMHSKKEKTSVDPVKEVEKQKAAELVVNIVTEARVKKAIFKLIDEGQLPIELQPTDMGKVMKLLPRLVFDDCVKEENEIVKQLGEYAGKFISTEVAKLARKIVIGN